MTIYYKKPITKIDVVKWTGTVDSTYPAWFTSNIGKITVGGLVLNSDRLYLITLAGASLVPLNCYVCLDINRNIFMLTEYDLNKDWQSSV